MSQLVKLNVGGFHFETTVATLTRDPESMLAKMIEQPNEKKLIAEGKELFIDRDGTHFAYILNYLRDSDSVVLPPGNAHIRPWLMQEANFYRLSDLAKFAQSIGSFKADDIVQLDGDKGIAYLESVAYTPYQNFHLCWVCANKDSVRRGLDFTKKEGFKPNHGALIGRIINAGSKCAIVKIADSCLHAAFTDTRFARNDDYHEIHIPLMYLRLA